MRGVLLLGLAVLAGCGRGKPEGEDPAPAAPEPAPVSGHPEPVTAPDPVTRGDLEVKVVAGILDGENLAIAVAISNANPTRQLEYKSWRGSVGRATDDLGNHYPEQDVPRRFDEGFARTFRGKGDRIALGGGVVLSGRPRADVIAFPRPVPAASRVDIELPGENVGEALPIRFAVPKAIWAKQ